VAQVPLLHPVRVEAVRAELSVGRLPEQVRRVLGQARAATAEAEGQEVAVVLGEAATLAEPRAVVEAAVAAARQVVVQGPPGVTAK